jgi:Fe-S cluster biogenesis protein NfuA
MAGPAHARNVGEQIEQLLDSLQSRLEPRAYDAAIELVQHITDLYGAGITRIVELAGDALGDQGPAFVRTLAADELVGSLLLVHGLHPDGLRQRVEEALERVRPFLAGHGGGVELLDIDDVLSAVQLRLLGSCDSCPSSAITLRSTVERAILEAAPEVSVIDVEESAHATADMPISLSAKPIAFDPATGCGAVR